MADLKEKVVLVTGAAGAIGAAVVAAIKRAGGTAIATDLDGRPASMPRSTSPRKPTGSASSPRSSESTAGSTGW